MGGREVAKNKECLLGQLDGDRIAGKECVVDEQTFEDLFHPCHQ